MGCCVGVLSSPWSMLVSGFQSRALLVRLGAPSTHVSPLMPSSIELDSTSHTKRVALTPSGTSIRTMTCVSFCIRSYAAIALSEDSTSSSPHRAHCFCFSCCYVSSVFASSWQQRARHGSLPHPPVKGGDRSAAIPSEVSTSSSTRDGGGSQAPKALVFLCFFHSFDWFWRRRRRGPAGGSDQNQCQSVIQATFAPRACSWSFKATERTTTRRALCNSQAGADPSSHSPSRSIPTCPYNTAPATWIPRSVDKASQ